MTEANATPPSIDASPTPSVDDGLPIVAVASTCAEIWARSIDLFEFCGAQVTLSPPGWQQRWWARACHQHARHIELAAERMPTIPIVDAPALVDSASEQIGRWPSAADGPTDGWRMRTAQLGDLLTRAGAAIEPTLDPSTARMLELIRADLARLSADVDR